MKLGVVIVGIDGVIMGGHKKGLKLGAVILGIAGNCVTNPLADTWG